jgi:hypothetical protein
MSTTLKDLLKELEGIVKTLQTGGTPAKETVSLAHTNFMTREDLSDDFKNRMNFYLYELHDHEYDSSEMFNQGQGLLEVLTTHSELADPVSKSSSVED